MNRKTLGLLIPPFLLIAACEPPDVVIDEQDAPTQALNTPTPTAFVQGRLDVSPGRIDFGPVGVGCRAQKSVTIQNIGQTPIRIYGVSTEIAPEVFLIDDRTGTLNYLDFWELPTFYAPNGARENSYGEIWIQSDDPNTELHKVELAGGLASGAERFDRLHQVEALPSDFLWVMDASGSMAEDINRVLNSFNVFIQGLADEGVNYHMGFVTMDIPNDKGYLVGSYGDDNLPYITRDMGQGAVSSLISNMANEANNNQNDTEAGLQAISIALSPDNLDEDTGRHRGFLREGAQLVIVVISDDHDYSDARPAVYHNELLELKGSVDNIAFHGIIASEEYEVKSEGNPDGCADGKGEEYLDMVYAFGGEIESVCSSDFSAILATLGSYDKAEVTDTFPLSGPPLIEAGINVEVGEPDGSNMVVAEEGIDWTYHASSNSIVFEPDHLPRAGATVEISYIDAGACNE